MNLIFCWIAVCKSGRLIYPCCLIFICHGNGCSFAFITFDRKDQALKAIQHMNGNVLGNRPIKGMSGSTNKPKFAFTASPRFNNNLYIFVASTTDSESCQNSRT